MEEEIQPGSVFHEYPRLVERDTRQYFRARDHRSFTFGSAKPNGIWFSKAGPTKRANGGKMQLMPSLISENDLIRRTLTMSRKRPPSVI